MERALTQRRGFEKAANFESKQRNGQEIASKWGVWVSDALEKMLGDSAGCFGFGKGASTEEDLSERVNASGKT